MSLNKWLSYYFTVGSFHCWLAIQLLHETGA